MQLGQFNRLPPKPEHLSGVLEVLKDGYPHTPKAIAESSGLSLTAVHGAVARLAKEGEVELLEQATTPKLRVKLLK